MKKRQKKAIYYVVLGLILVAMLAVRVYDINRASGKKQPAEAVSDPGPAADESSENAAQEPELKQLTLKGDNGEVLELPENTSELEVSEYWLISALCDSSQQLTALSRIHLADDLAFSAQDVLSLKESFPDCQVEYTVVVLGNSVKPDTESLDLSSINSSQVEETAGQLKKLPELKTVKLASASSSGENGTASESNTGVEISGNLSLQDLSIFAAQCPGVAFDYPFCLFGEKVSTADTSLEFVNRKEIGNEGVELLKTVLPAMGSLKYLKLDNCGTDSVTMASLRDAFPDVKVVWRIWFSGLGECGDGSIATYNCLTDTERIWATGHVTDYFAGELNYCTDVKYLDLGHNCITNIDFVRNMPKLQVAVLSITWVEDISPLAACPELEYLEVFTSRVSDVSPLASLTNLRHLNISNLGDLTDISGIYDLNLERLYCTMCKIPVEQQEEFQSRHPDCECEFRIVDPSKGYWRFKDGNYENTDPENRVPRYAKLVEQLGYDNMSNLSK